MLKYESMKEKRRMKPGHLGSLPDRLPMTVAIFVPVFTVIRGGSDIFLLWMVTVKGRAEWWRDVG